MQILVCGDTTPCSCNSLIHAHVSRCQGHACLNAKASQCMSRCIIAYTRHTGTSAVVDRHVDSDGSCAQYLINRCCCGARRTRARIRALQAHTGVVVQGDLSATFPDATPNSRGRIARCNWPWCTCQNMMSCTLTTVWYHVHVQSCI